MNYNTQFLYEIFSKCRLCGTSAKCGSFMVPILESSVPVRAGDPADDGELRVRMRECLQMEVTDNDNMPPLVCGVCVGRVNSFYEFMKNARDVCSNTRRRLGLPPLPRAPVTANRGGSDGDRILGVAESIYVDKDPPPPPAQPPAPKYRPGPASKRGLQKEIQNLLKGTSVTITKTSRRGRSPDDAAVTQDSMKPPADVAYQPPPPKRGRDVIKTTTSESGKQVRLIIKQPIEPTPPPAPKPRPSRPGPKSSKREELPPPPPQQQQAMPEIGSKFRIQFESPKQNKKEAKPKEKEKKTFSAPEVPAPKCKTGSKQPTCVVCRQGFSTGGALYTHQSTHTVHYTDPKQACAACGEWFITAEEAADHHQWHKGGNVPYRCRRCHGVFKRNLAYMQHVENNCVPWREGRGGEAAPPGGQCKTCKKTFSVYKTLKIHEAMCGLSKKIKEEPSLVTIVKKKKEEPSLATIVKKKDKPSLASIVKKKKEESSLATIVKKKKEESSLATIVKKKKEESSLATIVKKKKEEPSLATIVKKKKEEPSLVSIVKKEKPNLAGVKKKKVELSLAGVKKKKNVLSLVPAAMRRRLVAMQVRVARCDPLLRARTRTVNVANVPTDFGLDKQTVYPYMKRQPLAAATVKTECWSTDGMVRLHDIQNELYKEEDYVHWDSDLSSDEDEFQNDKQTGRKVDNLCVLSLKTLFSSRCLGKVPRKLRKIKPDKNFDSLFNNDEDFSVNINSIIGSLDDDGDKSGDNKISDNSESHNDKIKLLSDKIDKALDYGSDSLIDNTGPTNDDFDSLFNNKSDAKVDGDTNTSQVDNGKINDDVSDKAVDNNKSVDGSETGAKNGDVTANNVETSNLAGFDIDMDIISEIKTVNGEKDIAISEKMDTLGQCVKSDAKQFLDRISDEEFNFDA